jgi:predicted MPP superfamily phosphohydrolase
MLLAVLLIIIGLGLVTLAYASLVERNWFALRAHRVPCLPPGSSTVRILHISDLHFRRGQRLKRAFLARAARTSPDIVVGTGDFLGGAHSVDDTVEAMTQIRPKTAALYVLGSNDYYRSTPSNPFKYLAGPSNRHPVKGIPNPWRELVAGLEGRGWRLINNEATTIAVDGVGSFDVVGLDDPHLRRDDITVASPRSGEGFRLAVVHSPDAAPALAELGYDLIMCGHTHGGQIRVPGIGALVTNSTLPRAMARGLHRMNGSWLHVSAGMGTNPFAPVRFACRPEACVLELVSRDA